MDLGTLDGAMSPKVVAVRALEYIHRRLVAAHNPAQLA
jgi:hypothetical protein